MIDTRNFHVFFPEGCYRKRLTPQREEIINAIDLYIAQSSFDLDSFHQKKQSYLNAIGEVDEDETFMVLNQYIQPVFLELLNNGFAQEDLRNAEGEI